MVRTRFAPSPTGQLHLGSLRTALFAYLFAKKNGGDFLVRIEDTDQTREVKDGTLNIVRTLEQFGVQPNEGVYFDAEQKTVAQKGDVGPYIQSERLQIYKKYAEQLLEQGSAYVCFCTIERLTALREQQQAARQITRYDGLCKSLPADEVHRRKAAGESFVIRLPVPDDGFTEFDDVVYGHVRVPNADIDDQVLMKTDGFPTYHFAVVVDDHLMHITHVIRGEDWIPSAPKHVLIYRAFGWVVPTFVHVPQILRTDRTKLSKRKGDAFANDYLEKGYLRDALVNYIVLLGWNPGTEKELYMDNGVLDHDALAADFSLDRIQRSGAVFDIGKLTWMNGEYIRHMPIESLVQQLSPYWTHEGVGLDPAYDRSVLLLVRDRMKVLTEINALTTFFYIEPTVEPTLLVWKKSDAATAKKCLVALTAFLESRGEWTKDALESVTMEWIKNQGFTNGDVLWPMRVALSGEKNSPGPFDIAAVLGRNTTLRRLHAAVGS